MEECWNVGGVECWNTGMLECWNTGMEENCRAGMVVDLPADGRTVLRMCDADRGGKVFDRSSPTPFQHSNSLSFHHSNFPNIPVFHYSRIPILQYSNLMKVDLFDFDLPKRFIADHPAVPRDSARLLDLTSEGFADRVMRDLPACFRPGDLLIGNNTKVIPARLDGLRDAVKIEATLHMRTADDEWLAFAKPGKRLKVGQRVDFAEAATFVLSLTGAATNFSKPWKNMDACRFRRISNEKKANGKPIETTTKPSMPKRRGRSPRRPLVYILPKNFSKGWKNGA